MRVLTVQSTLLASAVLALPLFFNAAANAQTATPELEHAPVGRDPFNTVQAKDTAGFVWHLQRNPALRQRYARHFGIPEGEVVTFVKNALVLSTMQEDTSMTTFGVSKNGGIYPVKTRLKKGTKVWATREGVPVLKWNCSNPLEWKLPGQELREHPYRITVTPNSVVTPDESLAVSIPEYLTVPSTEQLSPEIDTSRLVAVVPPQPVFAPIVPAGNVAGDVVTANTGGGGGGGGFFLPLLLGAIPALIPGGGGDTNVVTPPTQVPESNTVALLSLGMLASGMGIVLKRRRK